MGGIQRGFHPGPPEIGAVEICRSTIFVLFLGAVYLFPPFFLGRT